MANSTNRAILIPEVRIYDTINTVLDIVREDYNKNINNPKESILYSIFGEYEGEPLKFTNFIFFEQAITCIIKNEISVNIGYNMQVEGRCSIHILLPSEQGEPLGIGANEGYIPNNEEENGYKEVYTQNMRCTYNLLISSENSLEVLIIYNLLKASLLALNAHLSLSGLMLPKISGQELNMQTDLIPAHVYHRSIMLEFIYELSVSDFFKKQLIKKFKITGIIESKADSYES